MANDTATSFFFTMVAFWIILMLFSSFSGLNLARTDITQHDKEVNVVTGFTNLLGIMTFQYTDEVPPLLALFLDGMFMLTIFSGVLMARG